MGVYIEVGFNVIFIILSKINKEDISNQIIKSIFSLVLFTAVLMNFLPFSL
tara:strand:+ start:20923 stop:21075 length:153 start_codon:yes stop_codon:yes gene_type:complete